MIYSCYMATTMHYQSVTFITNEICNANLYPYHGKYILPKSYRRIIFCKYYISYQIDADYKSYIEIFYDYSPHVSYWRAMPFKIYEPCKYASSNSYRRKVSYEYYMSYLVGADFKSYLEIICGCPPQASYWRTMPFITCEPCNCIHIETYWRKVISLFTYIYNSMLYVSECRNIFKILINTVNRTILINLTTSITV